MSKNYVKQFRIDNGIKFSGGIKLLNHKYSEHTWFVNDTEIYSALECDNNLKLLTYSNDSEVMSGLLNGEIEFEKVEKEYKQITHERALIDIQNKKEVYTKPLDDNSKYFLCKAMYDCGIQDNKITVVNNKGNLEFFLGMFRALDHSFFREVK